MLGKHPASALPTLYSSISPTGDQSLGVVCFGLSLPASLCFAVPVMVAMVTDVWLK
jgi:hypothetical protein